MLVFLLNALKIIIMLGFLVFIHEGGHFLIAKLFKVKVNEFALGFGPTIFSKEKGETKYAIRLIPLGGFVNLEGEEERSDKEGSFSNASLPKRILIVLAGATVNIIFGLLTYYILVSTAGNFYTTAVNYCIEDYAAQECGILPGDIITKINNKKVKNRNDISKLLSYNKDKQINISIIRDGKEVVINLIPTIIENNETNQKNYYLGVVFKKIDNTIGNKLYYGLLDTKEFSISIIDNLKQLFTGNISANQMVGIVGISDIVVKTSGLYEYVYIVALISLSLGVTNLLPIPPLDGGKVLIYIIELIRRKPMKEEIELKIQTWGFSILIALSIYVTYNDILRIF